MLTYVLPCLGAIAVTSMLLPTQHVAAAYDNTKKITLFTIDANDPYITDTLKTKVLYQLSEETNGLDFNQIDMENSSVTVSNMSYTRPGIQAVTILANIKQLDNANNTLSYSVTETAAIKVEKTSAPILKLKKSSVTVNNGDSWNPSSYIATVSDDSGTLPVLKEADNVDMNTDGEYYASYTAVDPEGNCTSAILNVCVKTPQEVLDERAAEQAAAEAEEQARQAAEAAAARARAAITPLDLSKLGSYAGGISTALSMVGNVPYVWGGSNPSTGFDCSGLVQYSYGISARTTGAQQALGTHRYDVENAPAGALYFYGSDSSPYHVAICLGNGTAVQALNPNRGIDVVSNADFMPSYYVVIGQ